MIALAAAVPAAGVLVRSAGRPFTRQSTGRRGPIIPVEHTRTSSGAHPYMAAAAWAVSLASARPGLPVPALAQPELSTTSRATPLPRCPLETTTGGAAVVEVVNTPAAAPDRDAVTTARSRAPSALIPQAVPAAAKPPAAVTLMASTPPPATRRSRRSRT